MVSWIVFVLMTTTVVAAVTRPFWRRAKREAASGDADSAVYRDQLSSIARERESGVIPESEAEATRAEIARRLLDHARREGPANRTEASSANRVWAAYGVALAVPLLAFGLYLAAGSPNLPSQPHAGRVGSPVEQASIDELVTKVEARLREKPDDGAGWDAIAPIYMLQQRYRDAAEAFAKAIALAGESPVRLTGLGESSIRANNGIVPDAARAAYVRLLTLEPDRMDARFWLALGKEQDGDLAGAADGFRDVLAKSAADAPWRKAAEERLAGIENKIGAKPPGGAGPEAEQLN